MLLKIKYIAVFFAVILFGKLYAQNDSIKYKSYEISSKFFINYLGFVKPNFALVPCNGGAFSPNWHLWYFKTQDSILSVEPSYLDTTLLITRTSSNIFEIIKVSVDTIRKKITPLLLTRGFVFYAVPSNFIKGLSFYVVGGHNKFNICQHYNSKVDTLFHCDKMINQLEVINKSTILFCYDNKLIIYPLAGKPSVLYDAGKYNIYGFTTDNASGLYISTDPGIVKIDHKKQQSLISTNSIKGKLRFFNKELYVLDADNKKLFVIPQTSTNPIQIETTTEESKEQPNSTKVPDILTNSTIINLVKTKLSDDLIINLINSSGVNFNMSVDSMIFLSNQNVSSAVIMAMKNAIKRKAIVKNFYIIAGSYPTEQQAIDAIAVLKNKGFTDAELVGKNSYGSYRIAYKGYATNEEASKDLTKIKQTINPSAWIIEKKLSN